ncbi:hypothetical protein HLB23_09210 [Nocardia uniformis]|uniref:Uncharacterized protein n=1 Tax=Nocardia uniformis TaxID=53432 RepID=A0A849C509_9NOCA|nr:hypothetical protein [Nocardia uniformis]NNH70039.1 hypothetical protein [Nocardia uniformis]
MIAIVWTFLIGLGIGGMAAWIILSLTATATAETHTATGRHDGWTVRSIVARIEQERLDADRTNSIGSSLHCG